MSSSTSGGIGLSGKLLILAYCDVVRALRRTLFVTIKTEQIIFHITLLQFLQLPFSSVHFRNEHDFFFSPGPPNLIISLQNKHVPQSSLLYASHSPHLLFLLLEPTIVPFGL